MEDEVRREMRKEKSLASRLGEFFLEVYERYGALNARQYAYRAEAAGIITKSEYLFNRANRELTDLRERGLLPWSAVLDSQREFNPWPVRGIENAEQAVAQEMKRFVGYPTRFTLPLGHYQPVIPVILTEKIGMVQYFELVAQKRCVSIYANRGSLGKSHFHEVVLAWIMKLAASGKMVQILYLGDCDDEGFQIPLTILTTMSKWGGVAPEFDIHDLYPRHPPKIENEGSVVRFRRIALNPDQVEEMNLRKDPVNPKSTIAKKFVEFKCEIEAMDPDLLRAMIERAIHDYWDKKAERRRRLEVEKLRREIGRLIKNLTKHWETNAE